MKHEEIYIVTDGCMWEINEQIGDEHPHAMEVVNIETGAIRYIKSGSKVSFIEGEISDIRTQKTYNKMPRNIQDNEERTTSKKKSKAGKTSGV